MKTNWPLDFWTEEFSIVGETYVHTAIAVYTAEKRPVKG